jgi:hypothetical protein
MRRRPAGSAVTLEEVVKSGAPAALRAAGRSIGTPYVRSQATVGGNVGSARPGCLVTPLASLGPVPSCSSGGFPLSSWVAGKHAGEGLCGGSVVVFVSAEVIP